MLQTATNLVKFESYKLQVQDELAFASNKLESLCVHRSDCVQKVSVWAPKLKTLTVQACYGGLTCGVHVILLDDHDLKALLPDNFVLSTDINISCVNSNVSPSSWYILKNHPRIGEIKTENDEF
mmetsp:Transcript_5775/g.7294  ORF Transcript_5775/g.7294 Transcript_5775/m.7294 type:complete len:124 (+) Transcript_5775:522-893(+)